MRGLVDTILLLALVAVAFLAGLLIKAAPKRVEPLKILQSLKTISEEGWKLLTRPNGQIVGLIPPGSEGEKPYHDTRFNIKRRRFHYFTLSGEKDEEPRDGVNRKTGQLEDIIPIESDGGIALTELANPSGKLEPILVGTRAERLKDKADESQAVRRELQRIGEEYRTKDRNYRRLQIKINNLKQEKDELAEDLENFRNLNERLGAENETFRTVVSAAKAESRQLRDAMEAMAERHADLADEIKKSLKAAREIKVAKYEAAGAEAVPKKVEAKKAEEEEEE